MRGPIDEALRDSHRTDRKAYGKRGTQAFARAVSFDRAAMRFDDVLDNRKPQPQTAKGSSRTAVSLPKAVKDLGQQFRADSTSVILHLKLNTGLLASQGDVDPSSLVSEFDRVRHKVPHHLLDSSGVTRGGAGSGIKIDVQADLFGLRGGSSHAQASVDDVGQLAGMDLYVQFTRDDA